MGFVELSRSSSVKDGQASWSTNFPSWLSSALNEDNLYSALNEDNLYSMLILALQFIYIFFIKKNVAKSSKLFLGIGP